MNSEERSNMIIECQSYLFPITLKKLSENRPVNHLVIGMIESDRVYLTHLSDIRLIETTSQRATQFLESGLTIRNRRKTNSINATRKKKRGKIAGMVDAVVRETPGGMAKELWTPFISLLEAEDMEPKEDKGDLSLTYLKKPGERKPYTFGAFSAAVSRAKKRRGI